MGIVWPLDIGGSQRTSWQSEHSLWLFPHDPSFAHLLVSSTFYLASLLRSKAPLFSGILMDGGGGTPCCHMTELLPRSCSWSAPTRICKQVRTIGDWPQGVEQDRTKLSFAVGSVPSAISRSSLPIRCVRVAWELIRLVNPTDIEHPMC